jgi:hypothetical protein
MAGVLSSYLLAFHHPAPHHISSSRPIRFPSLPAEDPAVSLPEPVALPPHQHQFGIEEPMLTGRVTDQSGRPLLGAAVKVTDLQGRQLVRTRTDRNGEYATTGFSDANAVVLPACQAVKPQPRSCSSARRNP